MARTDRRSNVALRAVLGAQCGKMRAAPKRVHFGRTAVHRGRVANAAIPRLAKRRRARHVRAVLAQPVASRLGCREGRGLRAQGARGRGLAERSSALRGAPVRHRHTGTDAPARLPRLSTREMVHNCGGRAKTRGYGSAEYTHTRCDMSDKREREGHRWTDAQRAWEERTEERPHPPDCATCAPKARTSPAADPGRYIDMVRALEDLRAELEAALAENAALRRLEAQARADAERFASFCEALARGLEPAPAAREAGMCAVCLASVPPRARVASVVVRRADGSMLHFCSECWGLQAPGHSGVAR